MRPEDSALVQAVLTGVLVIITTWYAYTTKVLASAAKAQNDALRTQLFDSFFLTLLEFQDRLRQSQSLLSGQFEGKGPKAFDLAAEFIIGEYRNKTPVPDTEAATLAAIDEVYRRVCHSHGSDFGHYFRHLYQIYRLLNTTDGIDRERYAALIRANLSTSELTVLFYNCLSELGRSRFKHLVEKYAAFEHLRDVSEIVTQHRRLYKPTAFGLPT